MSDVNEFKGRSEGFAFVKDKDGNEYLCPVGALKNKKDASEDELASCVDDVHAAVATREVG